VGIIIIICEHEDLTVLWNQGYTENVKLNYGYNNNENDKGESMHIDKCGSSSGQKCHTKGNGE